MVVGGYSIPSGYLDQIFIYDPQTDEWSVRKNAFDPKIFPKGKVGGNAIFSNGQDIFSFGGADEFDTPRGRANSLSLACRYNVESESWNSLAQPINPREGLVAILRGTKVYLVGGMREDAEEPSTVIEEVNLVTSEIGEKGRLIVGRLAPAAGIVDNQLIVAGGVIEPLFGMTDTIECLNLGGKQ